MSTKQMSEIAAKMKLATLTTGAWRATRLHRAESGKVNSDHHTGDAARVHVTLTNSTALHALTKLHAEAYEAHRRLTLPSVQDGLRLLPAGREFEHSAAMATFKARHDALAAQFVSEYDGERATAPARLNGLFDSSHWPSAQTVAGKFAFSTRYLACPSDGAWADWLAESATAAEEELHDRLRECLARVAERCGADGKLYQSVFSNLADVCALVPDLNFADSPQIAQAAQAARELSALDADTVREVKAARSDASAKARSILAILGGARKESAA